MVVDVVDILRLQLVAVVVDFVLDVERTVDVVLFAVAHQNRIHLRECLIGEFHHLVHVGVLVVGEVFLTLDAAVQGTGDVVAGVADTLDL